MPLEGYGAASQCLAAVRKYRGKDAEFAQWATQQGFDVETLGKALDMIPVSLPLPREYTLLASATLGNAGANREHLASLPVRTRIFVALHLAMQGDREGAKGVLASVTNDALMAASLADRQKVSLLLDEAVRWLEERAHQDQRGADVYELFKDYATEPYGSHHIHFWAGRCYLDLHEPQKAEACYRIAVSLMGWEEPGPFESHAALELCEALYDLGKYADALPILTALNADYRRHIFVRTRADNLLTAIAKKTGLPKGVAPSE